MTTVTQVRLARDLADVREGALGWGDIPARLLLEVHDKHEVELAPEELDQWVRANPEFTLGNDTYEVDRTDNGEATYRCGNWSALTFRSLDGYLWVTEAHPY